MRILYICQYFVPPDASGGTRAYEMARRLVQNGHKVTLLTSSAMLGNKFELKSKINKINFNGIELLVLKLPYSNKVKFKKRILIFFKFMLFTIFISLRHHHDLVFATSTPLTVALPGILLKTVKKRKFVFEVRDLWPEIPIAIGAIRSKVIIFLAKLLEQTAYNKADHIISLSPDWKTKICNSGIDKSKVTVISNSCDIELFHPNNCRNSMPSYLQPFAGRKIVLYAGTFGKANGVDYLIDIASLTRDTGEEEIVYLLVGSGMEEEILKEKAKNLGLHEKTVFFIPSTPKSEMPYLFKLATISCSIFIPLEELWANSANKFFDSLAANTPIMINYGGWQKEIIENYGVGFVIPPSNPQIAAKVLIDNIKNDNFLKEASQKCQDLAVNMFNRDMHAQKLEGIFKKTLFSH